MSKSEHGNINGEGVNTNGENNNELNQELILGIPETMCLAKEMKSGNIETITPTATQKIIFKKSDLLSVDESLTGTTEKKNDDDVNDDGSEDKERTLKQEMILMFDESISPTQEAILRYPEILGVDATDQISEPIADDPGNDNELSPTQEAILKFPEFFGVDTPVAAKLHDDVDYKEIDAAVNTACSLGSFSISELNDEDYVVMHDTNTETITDIPETMRLAEEMESKNNETQELISDNPDLLGVERISEAVTDDPINDKQLTPIFKSKEFSGFDTPIALTVTPLKIWQPGTRIINLDDGDGDDYLLSPYDDDVHESNASKLQKDIATYAWAFDEVDKDELMYISDDTSHNYSLQKFDM
ncbi:hypothetical protein LIER_33648 [Lithospermum erythrorhizon]|uniref:Uncharacterized protein n=1 Tax=Lithospermum erythrorhizon TaxID=34254 RepID=A0AAV3S0J2_LITER